MSVVDICAAHIHLPDRAIYYHFLHRGGYGEMSALCMLSG